MSDRFVRPIVYDNEYTTSSWAELNNKILDRGTTEGHIEKAKGVGSPIVSEILEYTDVH